MKYPLVIVGGGPAGYIMAIRAAQLGVNVLLVDKSKGLGGTCLSVGCIPSKALLQSAHLYEFAYHHFQEHGIEIDKLSLNFEKMQQRKEKIVTTLSSGIDFLMKKNRVERRQGSARLLSSHTLSIDDEIIEADKIILATGSLPIELPFLPFDETTVLSSTGALALEAVPKKLIVIGAGVIGLELGSFYRSLGSQVEFIEFLPQICPTFDLDASQSLKKSLEEKGILFHLQAKVIKGEKQEKGVEITFEKGGKADSIVGDKVLVAIGRKPNTKGLNLRSLGIECDSKGFIQTNEALQTTIASIYAVGDVAIGPMLAHKASEEGIALIENLYSSHKPSYNVHLIPNVVYTQPELSSVGFTEKELDEQSISFRVGKFPFKANSRAKVEGQIEGFIKVLVANEGNYLLGATLLGPHVSEMLPFFTLAIQEKIVLPRLLSLVFAHPTLSESIKEALLAADGRSLHF